MTDRIRVVVISEPGIAGVKRHVVDLLRRIDVEAFDVYFIYSLVRGDDAYVGEIADLSARGIECLQIPMDAPLSVRKDWSALRRMIRELRRIKPEIVHLHSSKAGGLGRLAALCVTPRPKTVYTPNAMACYKSRLYWGIEVGLGWLTSRSIAVSTSEQADWVRWKIPKAKQAAIIPNGFTAPPVPPINHREIQPGEPWVFGACGRICRQKNALLMFQAALEMLSRDPHARFIWIGDFGGDDESDAVRALLSSAGNPDRIEITGWVTEPGVQMRKLDIFCMVSRYEGLSYVLAEAQLLELPVIGVDVPGIIDLVQQDQTGVIATPDVESICKNLAVLRDDQRLRAQLGKAARQEIELNYTVPKMVDAIEEVYRELAKRGQSNDTTLQHSTSRSHS